MRQRNENGMNIPNGFQNNFHPLKKRSRIKRKQEGGQIICPLAFGWSYAAANLCYIDWWQK